MPEGRASRGWNLALWALQILLALLFGYAGVMKVTQPVATLAPIMPWTPDVPEALVRFIGVSELAGVLGLVLPALTRIRPALTPLAAHGLTLVMVLATGFHISRGDYHMVPVTLTLGALAAFVAWGRATKAPISARR